jgi:Fe-S-cluster containining protein
MLKKETKQISSKIGKNISDFADICITRNPYFFEMKKNKNGICIFLSSENKCNIYSYRPLICRFYPLELTDQINDKYKFSFTKECPGINQGKILDKQYFNNLFEFAKTKFQG